jgi:hypothetical protein
MRKIELFFFGGMLIKINFTRILHLISAKTYYYNFEAAYKLELFASKGKVIYNAVCLNFAIDTINFLAISGNFKHFSFFPQKNPEKSGPPFN